MSLNNPFAPSYDKIIENCRDIFSTSGEEEVLDYLAEVASNDYSCPDRCDAWAVNFYNENEADIMESV